MRAVLPMTVKRPFEQWHASGKTKGLLTPNQGEFLQNHYTVHDGNHDSAV